MSMREYPIRDFIRILNENGWFHEHHSSNHYVYSKNGFPNKLTVNFHERTVRPVIAKRLLKEAGIEL